MFHNLNIFIAAHTCMHVSIVVMCVGPAIKAPSFLQELLARNVGTVVEFLSHVLSFRRCQ